MAIYRHILYLRDTWQHLYRKMAICNDPLTGPQGQSPRDESPSVLHQADANVPSAGTVEPAIGSMSYRQFGNYLVLASTAVAVLVTVFHIFMHATTYSRPIEQRHIIRILAMVPVYATVSALSYNYVKHAISFEILRDCYESICIAAFFGLLCHYIRPDLHQQKDFFRRVEPKPWLWPLSALRRCTGGTSRGPFRTPRSGLTWFNIIWIGIFQYVFFRPAMTILAVVTQAFDRYCESSLNPAFGHIWVLVIEAVAVSIAMYCLIQFYFETRKELAHHRPLIKILSIKLVIFFSFWQSFVISILSAGHFLKPSNKASFSDIKIGLPAFLICVEMMLFSILHLFAYSWRPYLVPRGSLSETYQGKQKRYYGGFLGLSAVFHALNPLDLIKGIARGCRWLFVGIRNREMDSKIGLEPMKSDTSFPHGESRDDDDDGAPSSSYSKPHQPSATVGNWNRWPAREDETPLNPEKQQQRPTAPFTGQSKFSHETDGAAQTHPLHRPSQPQQAYDAPSNPQPYSAGNPYATPSPPPSYRTQVQQSQAPYTPTAPPTTAYPGGPPTQSRTELPDTSYRSPSGTFPLAMPEPGPYAPARYAPSSTSASASTAGSASGPASAYRPQTPTRSFYGRTMSANAPVSPPPPVDAAMQGLAQGQMRGSPLRDDRQRQGQGRGQGYPPGMLRPGGARGGGGGGGGGEPGVAF